MVVSFLFWKNRQKFLVDSELNSKTILGSFIFVFGLLLYIIGKSQDIDIFSLGSQIPVLIGIILIVRDLPTVLKFWFPLFFIIFMLPLPGFIVDAVTMPMKMAVSQVTQNLLFWLDFPISRTGVTLQIGQYKLLVADACAGMHTLISLEAMGLFYLNLVEHDSLFRNSVLATLIVPISFVANVTRVTVLVLVTYYFGDAAGQGFVHKFAGLVLFVVALMLIISIDSMLQYFVKCKIDNTKTVGV
jgi:exosortase B